MSCFIANSVARSAVRGGGGPERPDSGFKAAASATRRPRQPIQRFAQLIEQSEEHRLPRIPRQQAADYPPARRKNLRGNRHHRVTKRGEIHPQQLSFLFATQVRTTRTGRSLSSFSSGSCNISANHAFRLHASEPITM